MGKDEKIVGVHEFKSSGVQGRILVPGLRLGCVFTRKTSASSGLIQNLQPNWQLFGEMSIFNEDFRSLMPSLSLTPWPRPVFTLLNYLDSYLGA
jgi:hypothetical protein